MSVSVSIELTLWSCKISKYGANSDTKILFLETTEVQIILWIYIERHEFIVLRMAVHFGSYSQTSPKFSYLVKILEKTWGPRKNFAETGGQNFKGLTQKSVSFSDLATSHGQLSVFFGKVEQKIKLLRLVKKIIITEGKCMKMTIF